MELKPTILIVDDRPENLISLEAMLDDLDINIISASSGKEALTLLLHHDIALVLLDVQMPNMDGFEVADLMRASKKTKEIPIIFITAISTDEKHIYQGYASGAVDYICKPIIEPQILLSKVNTFCDLHLAKRKTEGALQSVRESELLWQRTFDAIGDMVIIQDTDFQMLQVNQATLDYFHLTTEEIVGKKCFELFSPDKDLCEHCPIYSVKNSLQPVTTGMSFGMPKRSCQVTVSPILDDSQTLLGIVHIVRDISDQKQLETQLRQAQKMEAIGTLAGGIAHDFNNILTPIVGYANLLRLQANDDIQMQQGLDTIMEAAGRATELVKQILSFSRKQEQEMTPLSIQPIVTEVLKLLNSTLPSTIEVQHDIDMDCGKILADPTQIHQLLMNLCTNSGYAMSERGGVLKVSVHCLDLSTSECSQLPRLSPGVHLCLEVSDTGSGIPTDIQKRVFEPYFTTKVKDQGTGMGLAVVHSIVVSHNGDIFLSSKEGKGSTFRIFLPVQQEETGKETHPSETVLAKGTEHILLVDDEESVIKVHQEMLTSLGYQVTITTDSNQALQWIRAEPEKFDLLFTDMTMPGLTGAELTRETLNLRADLPIIICTGFSELLSPQQAQELGVSAFLSKPVTLSRMASVTQKVLHQSQPKKAATPSQS